MKKIKRVSIKIKKEDGTVEERFITFTTSKVSGTSESLLVCDTVCPYGRVCPSLRDPLHPDDKSRCFNDFCFEVGFEAEEESLDNAYPIQGSLEEFFAGEDDIVKNIIENCKDRVVKVKDIVESYCSNFCEDYRKDLKNCKSTNGYCLLRNLFIKSVDNSSKEEQENNEE